jgi:pimeloyl-ACP methyl ester carboxylesterase
MNPIRARPTPPSVELHTITEGDITEKHRTPLLFVHGGWHASWCWEENFLPFFAKEGFACHAFDFRGHGKSEGMETLHNYRLADYVDDLGQAVEAVKEIPVLIAHSMGGLVAQRYAQEHDTAGLVLLAPIPLSGVGYGYVKAHPFTFLKFLVSRKGKTMIGGKKLSKSLFFSNDIPEELFQEYYQKLQDESFRVLFEVGRETKWKPLKNNPPLLIVEAGKDAVISKTRLAETAKLYGIELERLDNLAHDMMIDLEWRKAAELTNSWLSKNGF